MNSISQLHSSILTSPPQIPLSRVRGGGKIRLSPSPVGEGFRERLISEEGVSSGYSNEKVTDYQVLKDFYYSFPIVIITLY